MRADGPSRTTLNNFGSHLRCRYEQSGNVQELEAAIALSEAELRLAPQERPIRARILGTLGRHLSKRYDQTGSLQGLEAALRLLGRHHRPYIQAASHTANLLNFFSWSKIWQEHVQCYSSTSRSLEREDQQLFWDIYPD